MPNIMEFTYDQLIDAVDQQVLEQLDTIVSEIYREEIESLDLNIEEDDQATVIRKFVERVAMRTALVVFILSQEPSGTAEADAELTIPSEVLSTIITRILKQGSINLTLTTD